MKQVLSIQDLSCLGKCSLTVALPVLSSMGCACSVLPTAVLSTHTAFPDPHIRSLTEDILPICEHMQSTGVAFDAVSVGYLADPAQAAAVETVLKNLNTLTVIDPAMGDHGRLYSGLSSAHVAAMKQLCKNADILLPNVTEAALLTGIPYQENASRDYYRALLEGMLALGASAVIITGVSLEPEKTGFLGFSRENGEFSYQADLIPRKCHGTGDLFTAVLTGAYVRGKDLPDAATLAARFVEKTVSATRASTPFGVEFETQLPWLWEQL